MSNRAILYARVSTPKQAELFSLGYQIEQERQYTTELGLSVVAELRDDQSGRKMERDGLEEACRMLESDEADILVTWKFDRLHRNYVNSVLLRDRIRRAGKSLHYAQARQISGKTARERLPEDIQYIMAEIEADDILERTASGKRSAIEAGRFLGLGKPPFGYEKEGRGRELKISMAPEPAAIILLIYDWYVFGEDDIPPMNTQQIADKLTSMGVPTPIEYLPERSHLRKRQSGVWDRNSISRILRESAYRGTFYQYKKKKIGGYVKRNPNPDERIGVPMPSIVEESTWNLAQEKLDRGRELADRGALFDYLVGRRIRCACGYKMSSTTSHCTWKNKKNGTEQDKHYSRYRCLGRSKDTATNCDMPLINSGDVDALVWEWVTEELANPVVLERKLREVQAEQHEGNIAQRDRLATLEAHRSEIELAVKRVLTMASRADVPDYLVEQMLSEENSKLKLTITEIDKLQKEIATPLKDEAISSLVEFSGMIRTNLTILGENFAGRRTIVDGLDVTVEAFRQDGEVYIRMKSILNPDGILRRVFASSRTDEQKTQNPRIAIEAIRKLSTTMTIKLAA